MLEGHGTTCPSSIEDPASSIQYLKRFFDAEIDSIRVFAKPNISTQIYLFFFVKEKS
jgi:hypothetical protein